MLAVRGDDFQCGQSARLQAPFPKKRMHQGDTQSLAHADQCIPCVVCELMKKLKSFTNRTDVRDAFFNFCDHCTVCVSVKQSIARI